MTSSIKPHGFYLSKGPINLIPLTIDYLPLLTKWYSDPELVYWTDGGVGLDPNYDIDMIKKNITKSLKPLFAF